MNIKQATGHTAAQIRAMSPSQSQNLIDQLEDDNHHTAVVMVQAARDNRGAIVKALEALDDLHAALGHMPMPAIELREYLRKSA